MAAPFRCCDCGREPSSLELVTLGHHEEPVLSWMCKRCVLNYPCVVDAWAKVDSHYFLTQLAGSVSMQGLLN